jgi:hypothetical protein
MKLFIVSILLFFANASFSQWKNETVKNGFDEPFKISTTPVNNKCHLKLEDIGAVDEEKYVTDTIFENGKISAYKYAWRKVFAVSMDLVGSYFCQDDPTIEILLTVGEVDKKYTFKGSTHNNRKGIEIKRNIMDDPQFILDFEKASYISIRVNDTECEIEVFRYKMTGSKSAVQFMKRTQ